MCSATTGSCRAGSSVRTSSPPGRGGKRSSGNGCSTNDLLLWGLTRRPETAAEPGRVIRLQLRAGRDQGHGLLVLGGEPRPPRARPAGPGQVGPVPLHGRGQTLLRRGQANGEG